MRFSLILENENGEQIDMTTTANQYMTSKIDGLYPPAGTISTSTYAGMNGSYLNNAFIEKRNIVISFEMRGVKLENRRHALYRVVRTGRYIKVLYKTSSIDVYAEGYVETCEIDHFTALTSGQISIICPDIYFYSTHPTYAYGGLLAGAFHFPFPSDMQPFPLGVMRTRTPDPSCKYIIVALKRTKNPPSAGLNEKQLYFMRKEKYLCNILS